MKELVRTIVRALVDSPEEIDIREIEGSNTRILEIKVSEQDVGKLFFMPRPCRGSGCDPFL